VVFASLMMLAFLVDQAQQLASELFQAVLKQGGSPYPIVGTCAGFVL